MKQRLSTLVLTVAAIFVISIWYYNNTVGLPKEVEAVAIVAQPSADIVTLEEMDAFLPVWSKYAKNKISENKFNQISLSDKKTSSQLANWLKNKGWEVERFFYVEQRLSAIIKTIYLQKHSEDTIKALDNQLKSETNPQIIDNIKKLISSQEQTSNVEQVSVAEMSMVSPRLEEIEKILEGK